MQYRPAASPVDAYIAPEWFNTEQDKLFRKLWQFFTFASLVDQPNKFVAKTLAGIPIVVQNFDGELRAFENICPHRQAPLQTEKQGCRPLTCAYHGWNFGSEGKLHAIPYDEFYQFVPEQRQEICLRRFAIKKIGGLIFINLSDNPIPLEKQFSQQFIDSLTGVSAHFDNQIIATTFQARRFNWKLVFENLRDGLHASFLHKKTINSIVGFRPWMPVAEIWQNYFDERNMPHTSDYDHFDEVRKYFSKGGPDSKLHGLTAEVWHKQVYRYKDQDDYYNWLVFPNMHIASSGGYAFTLEHYIPRAPDVTDVDVYFLLAKPRQEIPQARATLLEMLKFTSRVLSEDIGMLEQVQSVMHQNMAPSHWGAFELRSHRMATWMTKVVQGDIQI